MARLDAHQCWSRLRAADHGVLGTVHTERGPDLVPVVFVVVGDEVVIPVDTVKPKSGRRLQRLVNLERDSRASVLVDHYDDNWTQLWWVRASGTAAEATPTEGERAALADRFPAYSAAGAVPSVIRLAAPAVTGWRAG